MSLSDPKAFQRRFGALLADPTAAGLEPALVRALTIHRNTATKAAVDALGENYPVVRALVGEEPFMACAVEYVSARPPVDPRLCDYGASFADFLADYPPFVELPYLRDCARVERAVIEALFAADAVPASGSDFDGGIDPGLALQLHPAARRVHCSAPAGSIWRAHQPDSLDALDALAWRTEDCLVTRPANAVQVLPLDPAASAFLEAAAAGRTIGEAAEAGAEHGDLAAAFFSLLAAGAFRRPLDAGRFL